MMRGEKLFDRSSKLYARGDQHDQEVAHTLEVGDEVRGEDDAHLLVRDCLHQYLKEFPAGERVKAGDWLVEYEELGSLRDGQGEGQLGPLSA
jgi:hypothetical protein